VFGHAAATVLGAVVVFTSNAAGTADVERFRVSGANDSTSVFTWQNGTHTGIDITAASDLKHSGTKVIGARVIDARCDDAINSGDATTDGVIDSLRDAMITHGLIAAA
ncbi:hypothetical protein LCGC14_2766760, partial [marine sediment metagenome]